MLLEEVFDLNHVGMTTFEQTAAFLDEIQQPATEHLLFAFGERMNPAVANRGGQGEGKELLHREGLAVLTGAAHIGNRKTAAPQSLLYAKPGPQDCAGRMSSLY